jgi:hypothetical protein
MALVTTGLTNGGRTTHYQIQYDDSLSSADGKDRANKLIAVCENDFALMSGWFGGIALTVSIPITVQITPGPYASAGWGPPIRLTPGNGSDINLVRYLLVSEVTEMFMMAQGKGWFGSGNEGSAGEGLSRFLAAQFLIANGLGNTEPGFALANSWMTSTRDDFVNHVDVLDHAIDPKTGCAILFIYYLHVQLGFSINSIVAAAAPELSGVYKNLTGDARDPFPHFKAILDFSFPGTKAIPGPNPDNPFPLPLPPVPPPPPHIEVCERLSVQIGELGEALLEATRAGDHARIAELERELGAAQRTYQKDCSGHARFKHEALRNALPPIFRVRRASSLNPQQ